MPERTITFAGTLDPGDMSAADDMVTIHRQERDHLDAFLNCLPEGDRERFRELVDSMRPGMTMTRSAGTRYGPTTRSPRPGKVMRIPWMGEFAGMGIDDIVNRQAPDAALGFVPGHDLEVWLLPVVDATFEILLTPAGEWEAGSCLTFRRSRRSSGRTPPGTSLHAGSSRNT